MNIDNRHSQLKDYLTQVYNFSGKEGMPRITHNLIAQKLEDGESTIQKFLKGTTKKPLKLLANFTRIYPLEFNRWPQNTFTIGRQLVLADVCYFLGVQTLVSLQPLAMSAAASDPFINPSLTSLSFSRNPLVNTSYPGYQSGICGYDHISLQPLAMSAAAAAASDPIITLSFSSSSINPPQTVIKTKFPRPEKAPVIIGYRGHQSDKDGAGMLYDHMAIQNACGRETKVSYSNDPSTANALRLFSNAINNHTAQLFFGPLNAQFRRQPLAASASYEGGLLVIPGRVRVLESEYFRLQHEVRIIKDALNRGQPIVAICAGVWRLYEQLYVFSNPNGAIPHNLLVDVNDHNYGGGMLRLGGGGTNVIYNVQMHKISILRGSALETAMKSNVSDQVPLETKVNSVHWKAVNPSLRPANVQISALSVQDPNITLTTRQQKLYAPDQNTVEAIETVYGAPIMGFQWHPEGYNKDDSVDLNAHLHRNALKYMALAGDAYAAKVRMMADLKRKHPPIG